MKRLVMVIFAGGCATAGTFQTADTLGRGGWEAGGDLSALVIVDPASGNPWLLNPRLVGRAGVSDRVDLGGSVGLDGLRASAKVQLNDDDGVVVSVMPGARYLALPNLGGTTVHLVGLEQAVLVGFPTSPGGQVVLVARSAEDLGLVDGSTTLLWWGGGSLGWSFRPDDAPVRVMPEVGLMAPLVISGDDSTEVGPDGLIVQAGFGVVFGRQTK